MKTSAVPQHTVHLGAATVSLYDGYTVTRFPHGASLTARHDDCASLGQAATAADLGLSVGQMNRGHDLCHSLLPVWLGLSTSPTLVGEVLGHPWPWAWQEEAVILALQRLLGTLEIDPWLLAAQIGRDA